MYKISPSNVVALREIGLDCTTHFLDWPRQERQFLRFLNNANTKYVVVVLHLRDMSTDPVGREVYFHGLDLASEILQKRQMFHLHIFSGPSDVVKAWLPKFPYTQFGFSNMVRSFSSSQCQGLKAVPEDHLMQETDAPYFNQNNFKVNVPCLLGNTAETVASIRGEGYEEVLEQTTGKALKLYMGTVGDQ